MPTVLRNARLLLPEGVAEGLDLSLAEGRIVRIERGIAGEGIDLDGNFLAPGFIDLHVHGARGRDTMEGSAEAIAEICDFHATGGTTTLCLTTATAPLDEVVKVLANFRGHPQVAGFHLEGPFLSPERPGAQRAEFLREPDAASVGRLLEFALDRASGHACAGIAGGAGGDRAFSRVRDRGQRRA